MSVAICFIAVLLLSVRTCAGLETVPQRFRIKQQLETPFNGDPGTKKCNPPVPLAQNTTSFLFTSHYVFANVCEGIAGVLAPGYHFVFSYQHQVDENIRFLFCNVSEIEIERNAAIYNITCDVQEAKRKFGVAEVFLVLLLLITAVTIVLSLLKSNTTLLDLKKKTAGASTANAAAANETTNLLPSATQPSGNEPSATQPSVKPTSAT